MASGTMTSEIAMFRNSHAGVQVFLFRVDGIASGGSGLPMGLAGISEWLSHQPEKSGDMRNHRPYDPRPHSPRTHDYLQLQKISIGVMSGQFRVEALVMVANGHF